MTSRIADRDDESWDLTPGQEAELEESIAEAERGEVVPAEEVLARLRLIAAQYKQQQGE